MFKKKGENEFILLKIGDNNDRTRRVADNFKDQIPKSQVII